MPHYPNAGGRGRPPHRSISPNLLIGCSISSDHGWPKLIRMQFRYSLFAEKVGPGARLMLSSSEGVGVGGEFDPHEA